MNIEEEAREYANSFPISPNTECGESYRLGLKDGYLTKAYFTKKEVLQAQIDVFNDLLNKSENPYADICKYMIKKRNQLQQQLKELK